MSGATDLVEFEESGLRWLAEAPTADAVRREVAAPLDDLEARDDVVLIKRNLVRAVLRVPLENGTRVIVKRYAVRGIGDPVKYLFKPSRAAAEWSVGRGLERAGIPTAVPLAKAERHRGVLRDAALVTREIPDAVHLNAYVVAHFRDGDEAAARRAALYDRLARIVRRMHAAGYVHNDLHGGNILVNGPPSDPTPHIIDLHSVSHSAAPSASARWFDLVKLLHSIRTCSTPQERIALCRSYEDETGAPSGTALTDLLAAGTLGRVLEPRIVAMERKRVRSRTRRALERSSRFDVGRTGPYRIHHLREIPAAAFGALVDAHRATLREGGTDVLKDSRRSALTRQTLRGPDGDRAVIVKEFRVGGLAERAKNQVRRPRAVASWLGGNGLRVRGFAVAEPLALLLRGRGLFLSEGFLVMEDLGDATRADLVAVQRYAGPLSADERAEKRGLVRAAARLFRDLHAAGVYHGDLKAVNLFVREAPAGPTIVIADYDRVEFDAPVPARRRIKNLAQLSASVAICISLADRLRFFREYAAGDPALAADWKEWFAAVVALCRQKIVVRMEPIE